MGGYIYILTNPSFSEGLVKIGKSDSDPKARKRDLDSATGIPTPFDLQYAAFVDDHHAVEHNVHRRLSAKRRNSRREFFEMSVPEAIASIRMFATVISEEVYYLSPEEAAQEEVRLRERLKEEEDRRQAAEARQIAIWDWLYAVNAPIEATRGNFLASELSEARQKFGLVVGVATAIAYYNFELGGAVLIGLVAGGYYLFKIGNMKLSLSKEAERRFPLKTEKDFPLTCDNEQRHITVVGCRRCNQKVRFPAGRHLKIRCPKCHASWETGK